MVLLFVQHYPHYLSPAQQGIRPTSLVQNKFIPLTYQHTLASPSQSPQKSNTTPNTNQQQASKPRTQKPAKHECFYIKKEINIPMIASSKSTSPQEKKIIKYFQLIGIFYQKT